MDMILHLHFTNEGMALVGFCLLLRGRYLLSIQKQNCCNISTQKKFISPFRHYCKLIPSLFDWRYV
jgi:hypothetical protein